MKTLCIIQGGGCRQIESAIGVLKAMDELKINIDLYRGASAGAIVSALHASGLNGKSMEHIIRNTDIDDLFKSSTWQWIKMFTPGIKTNWIYDNTGVLRLLSNYMTDDATARVQVSVTRLKDYKSLMLAGTPTTVLISSDMPEVFEPGKIGEEYYIDGGVINNVPTIPLTEIASYARVYIILCPQDAPHKKSSWTKLGRALKAVNESTEREAHQITEDARWGDLPNVTIIRPTPFRSHLLKWSDNHDLINHAYEYTLNQLSD